MPPMPVVLHCINDAALTFHVPAKLILSILATERGKIGQLVKNKNGTYDIGPMQINSSSLAELSKYHIQQSDIQFDFCTNVKVGAWMLAKKIAHRNNLLEGIGDYNSHTPQFNRNYYTQVRIHFTQINSLL
ncbi:MAG: lytic transglycosylase domain-containing protein [Gammaproteobacteria bacterium]